MACVSQLKAHLENLKENIKTTQEQLSAYRRIKKGTIIYAECLHVLVAIGGVGEWRSSYRPALLMYKNWGYREFGFALEFNVVASEDSSLYNSPYQFEYSGKRAEIRGPEYRFANRIRIIPLDVLPLYLYFQNKTPLFEKLLKGIKV
jgi:hypothetical protein